MVELRKRKAPAQSPAPEKKTKKEQERPTTRKPTKKAADTTTAAPSNEVPVPNVGDTVSLSGFGGEIETNEGAKTTLEELVNKSRSGVVLFTYPKASTPGCKFSCPCLNPACLSIWEFENLSAWEYATSCVYLFA